MGTKENGSIGKRLKRERSGTINMAELQQTQRDRIPLSSGNVLGGLLEASKRNNNYRGVLCWQS